MHTAFRWQTLGYLPLSLLRQVAHRARAATPGASAMYRMSVLIECGDAQGRPGLADAEGHEACLGGSGGRASTHAPDPRLRRRVAALQLQVVGTGPDRA